LNDFESQYCNRNCIDFSASSLATAELSYEKMVPATLKICCQALSRLEDDWLSQFLSGFSSKETDGDALDE